MPADPSPSAQLPAAVLWDMDGTLVDTEPCWMATEAALVEEFGGTWTPQDALRVVGMPLQRAAQVLRDHGVDLPLAAIAERLNDGVIAAVEREVVWRPGALRLIGDLRDAGVPCALVTMSYRRLAEAVLRRMLPRTFTVVVTGDEVRDGKPHPEAYLRAAALLGVDVQRCVAIEDSVPGVASAVSSGARTLGVPNVVAIQPRPGLSRAGSLTDVGLAELARIVGGEDLDLLPAAALLGR